MKYKVGICIGIGINTHASYCYLIFIIKYYTSSVSYFYVFLNVFYGKVFENVGDYLLSPSEC